MERYRFLAPILMVLAVIGGWAMADVAPRPHDNQERFDQRLPAKLVLVGDEKGVVWYNKSGSNWWWFSILGSPNMVSDVNYIWPAADGTQYSALITDGNGVLDWGYIDSNSLVYDDVNGFTLPTMTPGSRIFVDANGFPLYEDNDNAYFDDVNDFAGFALGHIASGTRPNNYIQVYKLLNFDPTLYNTSVGWSYDDSLEGPNNVRLGYYAGRDLVDGTQNTLGGRGSGQAVKHRDNNAFWGFEAGKNVGGGSYSNPVSSYKYTYLSENSEIWGIPVTDRTILTLDNGGDANDVGGGIVGLPCTGHPFVSGDVIRFVGTTNYSATTYTLTAGTTTNEVQFTSAYTAETFDGTEIPQKVIASLDSGGGDMVQDSSGNMYYGHNLNDAGDPNNYYVTKIATNGTITYDYDFLNTSWNPGSGRNIKGLAISDDDQFLYMWIEIPGATDYGYMSKWNLVTKAMVWQSAGVSYPGYDIAIDSDGNAYAAQTAGDNDVAKFNADTGSSSHLTLMGEPKEAGINGGCQYVCLVDNDMGLVIAAGQQSAAVGFGYDEDDYYNLAVRTFDDSSGYQTTVGSLYDSGGIRYTQIIGTGHVATDGAYIYVITATSTPDSTIYKYDTQLNLIKSVAGPNYGVGLYFDLWGNLVVVNQDWTTGQNDVLWFYDTDLNYVSKIEGMYTLTLRSWDASAGGAWVQGNAVFYPGIESQQVLGNSNTAIGSMALRGSSSGAEPNEASAGGYKSIYSIGSGSDLPTAWGAYSLFNLSTGDRDIGIGPYAGWPITTEDDYIVFDSRKRDTVSDMNSMSIIVGQTADDPNNQWLTLNVGELNLPYARVDVNDVNVAGDLVLDGFGTGSVLFTNGSDVVSENNANLSWDDTNKTLDVNAVDVNNVAVLKPDSAVFQPTADSTTFFQVKNAAGSSYPLNIDTTNIRVGINTNAPLGHLHVSAAGEPTFYFERTGVPQRWRFRIDSLGNFTFRDSTNNKNLFQVIPGATTDNLFVIDGFQGRVGINEFSPNTLIEATSTSPYLTFHNSTHEDTDGGRESIYYAKGEKGDGTEHTLGRQEFSHDGTGDDFLAKYILSLNKNAGADTLSDILTATQDSFVIQAPTDSTTFFQVLDSDGGTPIVNVDSTNERVAIGTSVSPLATLDVRSTDQTASFKSDSTVSAVSGRAFQVGVNGETYSRVVFYSNGFYGVGSGAAVRDVFIGRSAVNTLRIGTAYDGTGDGHLIVGGNLTIGSGTAATDYTMTFNGETNDGVLTWMEDEDYFKFSDDVLIDGTEKIYFRDTAIFINSSGDGQLDVDADTLIEITAPTIELAGDVVAEGTSSTPKDTTTLGVGVTTFAITSNVATLTGDGGGNTISTITGGKDGQLLTIIFVDALITITDTDAHTANTVDLAGTATNLTSADDTTLQLVYDGTSWYETSRSVN